MRPCTLCSLKNVTDNWKSYLSYIKKPNKCFKKKKFTVSGQPYKTNMQTFTSGAIALFSLGSTIWSTILLIIVSFPVISCSRKKTFIIPYHSYSFKIYRIYYVLSLHQIKILELITKKDAILRPFPVFYVIFTVFFSPVAIPLFTSYF